MTAASFLLFVVIGLLGAAHCAGMCGGIASALSLSAPPRTTARFPVAVAVVAPSHPAIDTALRTAAYNAGRIGSYMTAGAIAGGLSNSMQTLAAMASLQMAGYWLVNLALVVLGLHLIRAWQGFALLERAGGVLWRRIRPLMKPLLPADTPAKSLALGMLWGWVPCGMVYSVLLTAMLSGSAWTGAAIMLAFGIGTLPAMLTIGVAGARLRAWTGMRGVRLAGGIIVLSFGLLGLLRASGGMTPTWLDAFCLTPQAEAHR